MAIGRGNVDGKDLGEVVGVSGNKGPGVELPDKKLFQTTTDGHPRALDSEVFVLEDIAKNLNSNSTGNIDLISERPICNSCQGVIQQFRDMFPGVNLSVRAGAP